METVLERLSLILRDVFGEDDLVATPDLTAKHVDGWDSVGNVRLFLEIERKFAVRFSASEISSLRNVGELVRLLAKKSPDTQRS